jgi:uncharacterized membrane protein
VNKEYKRFIFIDLLRGWALIIMVEVHVFNAFIIPSLKETSLFGILNFINGLVAPSFLFVSGFAFAVSSDRKINELRKFKGYFWNKLSRIGLIFLAGYSLHIPFFSFSKILNDSYSHLITWFNVDILQCIAAGLLLLLILRVAIKSDKIFYGLLIFFTILISFISPIIWKTDFGNFLPIFFADFFNQVYGSFFPLFPWLFFLFAGAIISKLYVASRNSNTEEIFIKKLFYYGLIPIFLGHFFFSDLFNSPLFSIRPNPLFQYERLGYIVSIASFFWYYEFRRATIKSFVLDVSRESLLVYWLHLEVIYSKIWRGKSLEELVANNFSTIGCITSTLILIILMIIVSKTWGGFKRKFPKMIRPVTLFVIIITTILFLLR